MTKILQFRSCETLQMAKTFLMKSRTYQVRLVNFINIISITILSSLKVLINVLFHCNNFIQNIATMPQSKTRISNTTTQAIKSFVVTYTKEIDDVLNYKSISASVSRFSAKLYSELLINSIIKSKEQHENVAYSPICIHLMLALIMLGSHGKTKTELIKVFREP